jgi:4-amino-4-deoxy-L-arabinose transferase-like glycosyltransferase
MKKTHPVRDWFLPLSLAVLAAAIVTVMVVRFQAAPVPLERDEGEYALIGRSILDGVPPYLEAGNMKLPGTYYAYAAVMTVFGQTIEGIHLGLMVVNLLSTIILFLIARPLLGSAGAALAGAAFSIMSADLSVLGLFAHATHFVMLFALAGIWLLEQSSKSERRIPLLWGSGLCFGLAFLMKQSGAFFAMFGFLWELHNMLRRRPIPWKRLLLESGSLAGGIMLPYILIAALLTTQGVFEKFWFWTVEYARAYVSQVDWKTGLELFRMGITPIIRDNPVICFAALAGMIGSWLNSSGRRIAPFLLAFFVFSFLAVCPGFFFREHYFVQLLPAVALYAGTALFMLKEILAKYTNRSMAIQFAVLLVVVAFSLTPAMSTGRVLSAKTPDEFSRLVYGGNPFPESVKIAAYLERNTNPGDRIAVLGSEPQICFYAHRKSATEHIYMYGLMEMQPFALRMQEDMIAQVEKSKPPFVVFAWIPTSWLQRPGSEKKIFSWMDGFLSNYYEPVMVADIHADRTTWLTDKEAKYFAPRPESNSLIVFRRKTGN